MAKKMLINVMHPEEARVAIVEEGRLIDLDIETAGHEQTRGNVYRGVVVRVEPGLQAAFIDIGCKKLGFLQMGEIHPKHWQWREDIPEDQRNRRPRIQEILRRGQELIVQVEKGERENKGAALTTYLSLPGRYMVLMPDSDSAGISRKVEGEGERKKLKELAAELEIPEGYGYIMRTEAMGKKETELAKDLQYLVKLHHEIIEKGSNTKAPALIHQESDLIIRTVRDYFTADVDEILVDSKDVYKQAKALLKGIMPKYEKLVKLHQEKRPIFSKYQLEEQIDLMYEKKIPLKSGGSLYIEPTEALVSIDVNSGKGTGEKGVEETAFKTNIEAAEEAARQLRLRDLGGLIVIDFIDMRDRKHKMEVEKTLKNALKADKARVTVDRISQFGLLEMSRQRIKPALEQAAYLECPHCYGKGKVKSVESMALSFLRKAHAAAARGTAAEIRGGLPLEVAYFLLNRKKRELAQIENDYEVEITVKGKPSYLLNQMELDVVRREKPLEPAESGQEEHQPSPQPVQPIQPATEAAPAVLSEGGKKRKRRRKKKGHGQEPHPPETFVTTEPTPLDESAKPVSTEAQAPEQAGAQPAEEHKKKRRRRKRKKKPAPETVTLSESAATESILASPPAESPAMEAMPPEPAVTEEAKAQQPKRGGRPRKSTGKPAKSAGSKAAEPPAEGATQPPEPSTAAPTEEKPKRKRAPRRKKPAGSEA